ncbi:TetR family transcriptional regulator [Paenarthrobacter ureafaciens]|uniref:TetR/AcrR family transcriptional regulator n=1 Tax=Paenarthrobacter ureafaciens TaxID=37931 RepID=UPI0035711254|nr:TetR family transcriptional regulator [Paenarthrobacter ureafaciens]
MGRVVAWNTERTRELLLNAATVEFAAYGLSGARVDRIASEAGVNKERIYEYFGNKKSLFDVVVLSALTAISENVQLFGVGPLSVADYAARLFQYNEQDDTHSRLLFWKGLETGEEGLSSAIGIVSSSEMVDRLVTALPGIERNDASDLLLTILTLCSAWSPFTPFGRLLTEGNSNQGHHRRFVVANTVRLLADSLLSHTEVEPRNPRTCDEAFSSHSAARKRDQHAAAT